MTQPDDDSKLRLPPGVDRLSAHRARLKALAGAALDDPAIAGMVIKGSFALGIADEFSDLDLSFVVYDDRFDEALGRRDALVTAAGPPVAAFTGEHVGVPELLIVLYEDLVHVDFRYVALTEFPHPQTDLPCHVVWQSGTLLTERLVATSPPQPRVDLAWIEDRMWTWVWYTQTKILRGEIYEALDAIQFLRSNVLFPLLSVIHAKRPGGSRRMEQLVGDLEEDFAATVAAPDRPATMRALEKTVELYLALADPLLEQHGIEKAVAARRATLRALRGGLEFKPAT